MTSKAEMLISRHYIQICIRLQNNSQSDQHLMSVIIQPWKMRCMMCPEACLNMKL